MRPTAFVYRPALKTDVACRRCGRAIAHGSAVLTPFGPHVSEIMSTRVRLLALSERAQSLAYHVRCAIDVCAEGAQQALRLAPTSMAERDEWMTLASARVEAKLDAKRKHKRGKPIVVTPATDPLGRPRVRVLFVGSSNERAEPLDKNTASSLERFKLDADAALVDGTVTSTLREYALVRHEHATSIANDPSQPFVAGLYWQKTTAAVAHAFRHKLVEWCALGLPSPVLAIVGPDAANASARDKIVQRLRALLEKSGFDPDDAPVVASAVADDTFIEALGLALDDRAKVASAETDLQATERLIANLQRIVTENRDEAYPAALRQALRYYHRSSASTRRQMLNAAFEGARTPALAAVAIEQLRYIFVGLPRVSLTALARVMLSARGQLPAAFDLLVDYWRVGIGENQSLLQLLIETVCDAPNSQRAKRCAAHLAREADVGLYPQIEALIEREGPQSPLREALAPVLAAIDARAER